MRMSGDVSGAQLAGRRVGDLPYLFLKIEKTVLVIWKNALIVSIHRLNVHLCSNLKCYFKSTLEEKLRGFLSCVVDEMFIETPLF